MGRTCFTMLALQRYGSGMAFIALLLLASYAQAELIHQLEGVPEARPGYLHGYLSSEDRPDSQVLLPPPPDEGSAALALDQARNADMLKLRGSLLWQLAKSDADLSFPHAAGTFSCVLNTTITQQDTPHLYMLLRRSLADAGLASFAAKDFYQRPRPFLKNQKAICTPQKQSGLAQQGAYPSGHAAIGWAWALILSELAPDKGEALLVRGRAMGESREVCNVHWHSDVQAGRDLGAAVVARLHADPMFRAGVSAAREELEAARVRSLPPQRDCALERKALGAAH